MSSLGSAIVAGFTRCIDALMPPQCASCKAPVSATALHCAACWATLSPPAGTRCAICSMPLPDSWAAEATCLQCLKEPPAFDSARAPFVYAEAARQTVLHFKYGAEHLAPRMARAMHQNAPELFADGPLLIPVPLHRWRLFRRGFNQSALLARALGACSGCGVDLASLVRVRSTGSTRGLGRRARAKAVRGAFRVRPDRRAHIRGRPILLVDDVLTTGATASACARALRRAGALSVHVLTYARVAATGAAPYAMTNSIGAAPRGQHGEG